MKRRLRRRPIRDQPRSEKRIVVQPVVNLAEPQPEGRLPLDDVQSKTPIEGDRQKQVEGTIVHRQDVRQRHRHPDLPGRLDHRFVGEPQARRAFPVHEHFPVEVGLPFPAGRPDVADRPLPLQIEQRVARPHPLPDAHMPLGALDETRLPRAVIPEHEDVVQRAMAQRLQRVVGGRNRGHREQAGHQAHQPEAHEKSTR